MSTIGELLSNSPYSGDPFDATSDGIEVWDDSEPSGSRSKGLTINQLFRNYDPVVLADEANTFTEQQTVDTGAQEPPFSLGADQHGETVTGLSADQVKGNVPENFVDLISDLRNISANDFPGAFVSQLGDRTGTFLPNDSDPFGQGDDGAIAAQGSDNNWWIRQEPFEEGYINARWFGMKPSASAAANQTALQEAINTAAQIGGVIVFIPAGRYDIGGPIYLHYDATNNPGYPSATDAQGQIWLTGRGTPVEYKFDDLTSDPRGTELLFQNTSDHCFVADYGGNNATDRLLQFQMRGFGVRSVTSDVALLFSGMGQQSRLADVFLNLNDPASDGIHWLDTNTTSWRNVRISNDSTPNAGQTGVRIDNPNIGGAGLDDFTQVTSGGSDIGFEVGGGSGPESVGLYSCQSIGNRIGIRTKSGGVVNAHNHWYEAIGEHCAKVIENSTFWDINGRGGPASIANFQFGDDTLSTPVNDIGQGGLIGTRVFAVENVGVRVEGNSNQAGVMCIGVVLDPGSATGAIGYSAASPDADLSVISPYWSGFGGSFAQRYENPGNFQAIIDGEDGTYVMNNLPTSQPSTAGQLWNDGGTLKVA